MFHFLVAEPLAANQPFPLKFTLSLNGTALTSGRSIEASADVYNTLPRIVAMIGEPNWGSPLFNDWMHGSACPYPVSILILRGHYTQSNMSTATPLQTSPSGLAIPCFAYLVDQYLFQPLSAKAMSTADLILPIALRFPLGGYYGAGQPYNFSLPNGGVRVTPFEPGLCTVVAGDAWGQVAIIYFRVVQPTP